MRKSKPTKHELWLQRHQKWSAKLDRRLGAKKAAAVRAQGRATGGRNIAAVLGISESQLRAMRDPKHPTYDARLSWTVDKDPRSGRLTADIFALASLAWERAQETSDARRANVAKRKDRRPT